MELQSEGARRRLQGSQKALSNTRTGGIDQQSNDGRCGINRRSSSSRFGPTSTFKFVMPVRLPPGRLRLATSPILIGSTDTAKTIGMVARAAFAASHAGV